MSLEGLGQVADLNPSPATTSQVVVAQQVRILYGWALAESTGSATAKVRLRDGSSASGKLLAPITLAAGESVRDFFPVESVNVTNGAIYLEVVSGSVEGAVYWG